MTDKTNEIEKTLNYVKATMAYENLELSNELVEVFRKYLLGEYSQEKVFEEIKKIAQKEIDELRKNL